MHRIEKQSTKFQTIPPPPSSSTPLVEKLTEDEIQDILICCVFILQRMPKRILAALWTENDGANAEKMIRLLELIVDVFRLEMALQNVGIYEYVGKIMLIVLKKRFFDQKLTR